MKSRKSLFAVVCLAILTHSLANAQHIQQELATGSDRLSLQVQWMEQPVSGADIAISGLAYFGKFYKDRDALFDEAVVQSAALFTVRPGVKAGADLFYSNHAGLQPGVSLQFGFHITPARIVFSPTIAYANRTGTAMGKGTLLVETDFPIEKDWKLGISGLFTGSWNKFQTHDRSLAQIRIGPVYKNQFQLGVGYDYDGYGPDRISKTQLNLFIRKKF